MFLAKHKTLGKRFLKYSNTETSISVSTPTSTCSNIPKPLRACELSMHEWRKMMERKGNTVHVFPPNIKPSGIKS